MKSQRILVAPYWSKYHNSVIAYYETLEEKAGEFQYQKKTAMVMGQVDPKNYNMFHFGDIQFLESGNAEVVNLEFTRNLRQLSRISKRDRSMYRQFSTLPNIITCITPKQVIIGKGGTIQVDSKGDYEYNPAITIKNTSELEEVADTVAHHFSKEHQKKIEWFNFLSSTAQNFILKELSYDLNQVLDGTFEGYSLDTVTVGEALQTRGIQL